MKTFKKLLFGVALTLAMSVAASAQAHSVTLGWTKSTDDTGAAGQGYTIFRAGGACPASVTTTTGFTAVNAALVTGTTFTDSTVTTGAFCYIATFTSGGVSSVPSNTAPAVILPAKPTNVTVTGTT